MPAWTRRDPHDVARFAAAGAPHAGDEWGEQVSLCDAVRRGRTRSNLASAFRPNALWESTRETAGRDELNIDVMESGVIGSGVLDTVHANAVEAQARLHEENLRRELARSFVAQGSSDLEAREKVEVILRARRRRIEQGYIRSR
jgi:hypothetical protein